MRALVSLILLAALILASPSIAVAQGAGVKSATEWVTQCVSGLNPKTSSDIENGLACFNYVRGVADAVTVMGVLSDKKVVCIPADASAATLRDIGLKLFQKMPAKDRTVAAGVFIVLALKDAYPCE